VGKIKCNEKMHDYCTCQKKKIIMFSSAETLFLKNTSANAGIKLYNKLPNIIKKLEKIRTLKKRLTYFLLQHTFYSVDEYMSLCPTRFYCQSFLLMHNFIISKS
jgi:hypothetical protein